MVLFEKYGQHQPLNRQSERYAREGIDLPLSTLADHVGACAAALRPLHSLIEQHVMAAERLHGDDTPVPILAKGKTDTGRAWVYVRDDRPFGGADPPAVLFRASRDRSGDHPEEHLKSFAGILQADAYAGYNRLLAPDRQPGPIVEALCWAHARRKFFVLATSPPMPGGAAKLHRSPRSPSRRSPTSTRSWTSSARSTASRPSSASPSAGTTALCSSPISKPGAKLSRHAPVAQAMDYMLRRWDGFARFLGDGRICLTNNAAERSLRGLALGRKAWLFAGSDRGAERAAVIYSLIGTAKLNDIDP
ncbi:IS66 family transposase [Bosea sp. (in: a-proteobacteria)]